MAFYRYGPSSKRASVANFDIDNLPSMAFLKVVNMFRAPDLPKQNIPSENILNPEPPTPAPDSRHQVNQSEGTFVHPHEETEFLKHLKLKPKLLSEKPPPTKRKKKEEDEDYVPSTEDITEEDEDDATVHVEDLKPKSTILIFELF